MTRTGGDAVQGRKVPWLKAFPKRWDVVPAKRLFQESKLRALPDDQQLTASQAYGVIPQSEYIARSGQRVVQITRNLEQRKHVEPNDIVISMRSFEGGLERAWARGCIRSSYVVLRPSPEIDVGFYAHLFKSDVYISALQATSHFIRDGQDLNYNNFCLLDLPLPAIEEQRAISAFLDRITSTIDKLVLERKRVLDASLERVFLATAGTDTGEPVRDSGIPWMPRVPAHWDVKRARSLFRQARRPVAVGDEMVTAFRDGQVTLRKNRREDGYTEATLELGYQGVRAGELVIHGMDAFAGAIGVSDSDGKCTPEYSICQPLAPLDAHYFASVLRLMAQQDYIRVVCQAVRERAPRFRFSTFREIALPVPPMPEQSRIGDMVRAYERLKVVVRNETTKLLEYRRALVARAIVGKALDKGCV